MDDLISRQQAIDEANAWLLDCFEVPKQNRSCGLIRRLEDLPPAQPETGKWDFIGYQQFQCTKCGVVYTQEQLEGLKQSDDDLFPNYCPNCGAKMQRGECDAEC